MGHAPVNDTRRRRLFLAVDLTPEVRHGLAAFLADELAGTPLPGRSADPRSWHITVRYLGPSTDEQAERFLGYLGEHLSRAPFTLGFGGLGAFPRPSRATVLWLDVTRGAEALADLADAAEKAAEASGFPPEDRPYRPHLTLARLRPPRDVSALVGSVDRFPLTQTVDQVVLFSSEPGPDGPRYEPVAVLPLHG